MRLHLLADSKGIKIWAKASGRSRSMGWSTVALGVRSIWPSMLRCGLFQEAQDLFFGESALLHGPSFSLVDGLLSTSGWYALMGAGHWMPKLPRHIRDYLKIERIFHVLAYLANFLASPCPSSFSPGTTQDFPPQTYCQYSHHTTRLQAIDVGGKHLALGL